MPYRLRLCSSLQINVLPAEMIMHDIKELDIVKFTKKNSPDTKIILITGDDTIEEAFDAVMDGAEMYFIKPSRWEIRHFVDKIVE